MRRSTGSLPSGFTMIHTASPVKQPKRRQTCDPCRKAKIKCDKRTPICGRCLATGDLCDYGISRQGAWWRHRGRAKAVDHSTRSTAKLELELELEPLSVAAIATCLRPQTPNQQQRQQQQQQHQQVLLAAPPPPPPPPSLSLTLPISPTQGVNTPEYHDVLHHHHHDDKELTYPCFDDKPHARGMHAGQFTPPYSITSSPEDKKNPTTATAFCSASTAANPFEWPQSPSIVPQFAAAYPNDKSPADFAAPDPILAGRILRQNLPPHRCACASLILQALQTVEECLAAVSERQPRTAVVAAESANVLEINERNIECCWAVLQCEWCNADSNAASPITLIYTLIKRELLWVEDWTFAAEHPEMPPNDNLTHLPLLDAISDMHMKIGVAEAVAERWNAMLERLGDSQAYQSGACEFTRLAHALLLESLRTRLAFVSERLNQKINEPCLAVIRSIETFGMGAAAAAADNSLSQPLHAT